MKKKIRIAHGACCGEGAVISIDYKCEPRDEAEYVREAKLLLDVLENYLPSGTSRAMVDILASGDSWLARRIMEAAKRKILSDVICSNT